jgi:hypothetical protein
MKHNFFKILGNVDWDEADELLSKLKKQENDRVWKINSMTQFSETLNYAVALGALEAMDDISLTIEINDGKLMFKAYTSIGELDVSKSFCRSDVHVEIDGEDYDIEVVLDNADETYSLVLKDGIE